MQLLPQFIKKMATIYAPPLPNLSKFPKNHFIIEFTFTHQGKEDGWGIGPGYVSELANDPASVTLGQIIDKMEKDSGNYLGKEPYGPYPGLSNYAAYINEKEVPKETTLGQIHTHFNLVERRYYKNAVTIELKPRSLQF